MSNSHGADGSRVADFAIFDKLPHSVKELLWYAPDSLSSAQVRQTQKQWSLNANELYEEWFERIENYRRRVIVASYGYGHPQYKPDNERI